MTTGRSAFAELSSRNPTWPEERVVRELCERLLDDAEGHPPVAVELIASLCGIREIEYRRSGPAGMLLQREGSWIASVLADDGHERQRFTILHEAGHTLLPGFARGSAFYRCKGPRTREEQLCDLAAAELLLPRRFLREQLEGARIDLALAEQLASSYAASVQATSRRIVDLSSLPVTMMAFKEAYKPDDRGKHHLREPKLRLQWAHSNIPGAPYPLRHKSAAPDSPFVRAWRHEQVDAISDVQSFFADPTAQVRVSARRYGDTVLALLAPVERS
jgi:hypothetical protein